ncbi:23S rRNA (guanosine2251-2'-O)-methyltransferase [Limimonas halophila]|uniref:23S rRNA (Guanosine2251-2'-O)-methyltransferase n=1 Tax=Limimonas halophila TaxID=1082479 RepID=A0A1G7QZ28_9PROT|nr:RNA methyltransferase [Limimonas halophila]SDG03782.1 23S rRNA (guanosine2251-2'-O)-methyltransferase [Limimonas halophila]
MAKRKSAPTKQRRGAPDRVWLYGGHAVLAALANPARTCERLVLAAESRTRWADAVAHAGNARPAGALSLPDPEFPERRELARLLPEGAVHQDIAARVAPLTQPALADVVDGLPAETRAAVVLLDHVTDPQNVGAVLRSAAAFGAAAVVTTQRNAPPETGALAKAASGALEHVAMPREVNLARSITELQDAGFHLLGLAGDAAADLPAEAGETRTGLVMGAEGTGLRRLTRERVDQLVRIPAHGPLPDLNVSNAAAIALYEVIGRPGNTAPPDA